MGIILNCGWEQIVLTDMYGDVENIPKIQVEKK